MLNRAVESEEILYLYNLRRFGMKMDLSIMRSLAEQLGNPHENFKSVHVTGTNGKGSVCAMLYSILRRRYSVGLYTSPHVERYTERIIVDDKEIDEGYVVSFIRNWRPTIEKLASENRNPTFFEVTTALAFEYFSERGVDFGVLEVGLGGRLDATNIVTPEVSGIVTVDLEHTNVLGDTIEKIAWEKSGIIKSNVPVVVGEKKRDAVEVIKKVAEKRGARYHNVNDEMHVENVSINFDGTRFRALSPIREYDVRIPLIGKHQVLNALVAIRMAEILGENYSISHGDIEKGLAATHWRDRFEIKRREPLLIFDSAHNPSAMKILVNTVKDLGIHEILILFSMLSDKDIEKVLRILSTISRKIVVTEINYEKRRATLESIKRIAERYFPEIHAFKDSCSALKYALSTGENVIGTGSIYLLGELEKCLKSLQ